MDEKNLTYTRAVNPEDFAPTLIIKDIITKESWTVKVEDMENQKALLGDKFSLSDFLREFWLI